MIQSSGFPTKNPTRRKVGLGARSSECAGRVISGGGFKRDAEDWDVGSEGTAMEVMLEGGRRRIEVIGL